MISTVLISILSSPVFLIIPLFFSLPFFITFISINICPYFTNNFKQIVPTHQVQEFHASLNLLIDDFEDFRNTLCDVINRKRNDILEFTKIIFENCDNCFWWLKLRNTSYKIVLPSGISQVRHASVYPYIYDDFRNTLRDVMNKKRTDLESGASHDIGWVDVKDFSCLYFLSVVLLSFEFVLFFLFIVL